MNKRNQWSFPMLAALLAFCLPQLSQAQETVGTVHNIAEMKFAALPGLPTCAKGSVQSGDPSKGPSIIAAKLASGCTIPWHWHTANENVIVAKGTGRVSMKGDKTYTAMSGGIALLPARHVHQFHCVKSCTLFIHSDAAFDIHYVDASENEITPDEALKAVKEKAAGAMK